MRSQRCWSLAILLFTAGPVLAASPTKSFSEATTVVAVEVPVQVLLDGRPVRGLTAAEFEIVDGRRAQEITGFEVVDLTQQQAASPARVAPPPSGRRHFLLLFDLSFSQPGSILKARRAAQRLVLDHLYPSDLVAVATYTPGSGPTLLLGFTSDRQQAELAIETMGLPQLIERYADPLALVLGEATSGALALGASMEQGGRQGASLLAAGGGNDDMGVELYAYAFDASGGVRGFFAQNLQLEVAKLGPKLRAEGLKLFGSLDLPPGDYSLRVLARDSVTGANGLEVIPLVVPSFEGQQVVALPPLFAEAMTHGVVARAASDRQRPEPPYPFLLGEEFFLQNNRKKKYV